MIGNIYSESDLTPEIPTIVGLSKSTLLKTVMDASVEVSTYPAESYCWIDASLPYDSRASGVVILPSERYTGAFILNNVFVGERRLIGSGTGSRLVKAFVDAGLEIYPNQKTLHTGWTRLGAINALEKVFPGKVTVSLGADEDKQYGYGTDKNLEQMLQEHAPIEGKSFKAWQTNTLIQN